MNMRPSSTLHAAMKFPRFILKLALILGLLVGPVVTGPNHVQAAPGAIQGTVFRDTNGNGERADSSGEPGIGGVEVYVYDGNNAQVDGPGPNGAWLTNANGAYSVTGLQANRQFRLEFRTPAGENLLKPGPAGSGSGTTVVFAATGDENVDVGFYNPAQYCEENPDTVTSCFVLGLYNGSNATEPALVSVPYEARGHEQDETTKLSDHGDIGTVYGLAYQRTTERIYAAAYHKRFTGFGSGGPDAIYQIDRDGNVTGVLKLSAISNGAAAGSDVHDFTVVPNSGGEILDAASYGAVGRTSFGDLEISDDMSTLYVVNLLDRKIYGINVSTGNVSSAAVSTAWDSPDACSGSEHRPFGLGWKDDRLYVGSVCEDASNAFVHSINPAQGNWQLEVTVPLDYQRELIADASVEPGLLPPAPQPDNPNADWNGWSDDRSNYFVTYVGALPSVASSQYIREIALPQPMLSDIEFDGDEGMVLGFRDRFGDQTGYQALQETGSLELYSGVTAGDILRVCRSNGSWLVETGETGGCVANQGSVGANAQSGPGGKEYYYWDFFGRDSLTQDVSLSLPGNYHFETTSGGLLLLDGKETVLTTALDPFVFSSAGYLRLDNRTGRRAGIDTIDVATPVELESGGYTIFVSEDVAPTFGKANGLGDIEALCSAAPVEVGNRVWADNNGNGIQDAGEPPIAGVVIGLYDSSNTLIGSATTDSNGTYYFSSGPGTDSAHAQYEVAGLTTGTSYTIGILDTNFSTSSVLEGYLLTIANADGSTNGDIRDSDAAPLANSIGGTSTQSSIGVSFETGGPGDNNHSFDFGFVQMDLGDLPENGTSFSTTGSNAAGHQIVTAVYMGGGVDRDADGQPTLGADGDDNDSNDDEDGVTFLTPLVAGSSAQISVDANISGFLNAWIDFNSNGTFESGEQIATDQALIQGDNQLTVSVPADATGIMYSRFRFTRDNPSGDLSSAGRWNNGEIEDYVMAEVGDRVWLDNGTGGGGAADGIQNGSEPGVANVVVELLDSTGQPVIDGDGTPVTTLTDASGLYRFSGLVPSTYQVRFVPPTGWGFTLQNVGSEGTDSDANVQTGVSDAVTLPPGVSNLDVDAGLVALLSLGDLVWNDSNNNGIVDGGEDGIEGVALTLWTVDGTGSPLSEIGNQVTDENGLYLFAGLAEGDYIVQVDSSNFSNGGPLTGFINSTGNGVPAPDPDDDQNNDDNGDPAGGRGVLSQAISLMNMSEPTNDGDSDNTTNLTVDFGFFPTNAAVDIEKATNGEDADTGTGPLVGVGSTVVWTYVINNIGAVPLANVQVTDNIVGVDPQYVSGDVNNDGILQVSEEWTYQDTGIAIEGQYENISRVEGDPVDENGTPIPGENGQPLPPVTDEDPSHYFGLLPGIDLEKATNGPGQEPQDADLPTGPGIPAGETVTWTYVIQNTGNVALANVTVTDDLEGSICTIPLLGVGATETCTATGTATLGQYANVGFVTGDPVDDQGNPIPGENGQPLPPVTDEDPSHYFGNGPASIDIEKDTNGEDADTPTGPQIGVNDLVVWTYVVRNTGEFALANVTVTDNIQGVVPQYVNGDNNNDTILQVDEVWTYQATGGATLGQYANIGSTQGDPVDESGNPVVDLAGNPLPSPQDSDPSHYVGIADASIDLQKTVYAGHNGGNDCPGSELVQDKVGTEVTYCFVVTNTGATHLSNIQLADDDLSINLANMTLLFGNPDLLAPGGVLAYYYESTLTSDLLNTADTVGTPSDETGTPIPTLTDVTDEDTAEVKVLAAIGDYVWLDTNANGVQDAVELPLPGITVNLYDSSDQVLASQETDENGLYLFDGLVPGNYSIGFVLPTPDHFFSPKDQTSDDASDSDADITTGRTDIVALGSGQVDLSWDAGIYAPPQLEITKSSDVEKAQPGTPIVYTFAYRNRGLSEAKGVRVVETVPELVTVDLAASAQGWACDENQQSCVFEIGEIPAKTEGTIDLTFVVVTDAFFPSNVTVIENNVRIEYDDQNGQQPNGAGLTDNEQTAVEPPTSLNVAGEPAEVGSWFYLPLISAR